MGRLSFKRKSKTSSPVAQSPRDLSASPSEMPGKLNDDASLASNPNESPAAKSAKGAALSKSFSSSAKTSRSPSLGGRAPSSNNNDSGVFSEQLQRLRARLQSVVQGVREVAQSLDEPHSLISNVRDQLQTRQDAAAARRANAVSASANAPFRDSEAAAATAAAAAAAAAATGVSSTPGLTSAATPPASLSRGSSGIRDAGSSRLGGGSGSCADAAAVAGAIGSPFDVLGPDPSDSPEDALSTGAAITSDGGCGTADAVNLSVRARVAEVERRSRSSGGMAELLSALAGSMTVPEQQHQAATVAAVPAVPEAAVPPLPPLALDRSFGSGRRGGGGGYGADSLARRSFSGRLPGSVEAPTPPSSRPNSGIWRPVLILPTNHPAPPPSCPSTLEAAAALCGSSHPVMSDDGASRTTSGCGTVDAAAALAAADSVAADVAELLGSGNDDSLLAATANPAAAAAYLQDHPDTLRELWTLRARVRSQEADLASMVVQLSAKNAQLDHAQTALQAKERELAMMTERLTTVLTKLQSFQTAYMSHELLHQAHRPRSYQQQQQEQQQRPRSAGGEHEDADGTVVAAAASPPPLSPPMAAAAASPDGTDMVTATSSVLPASSTPQTPLRDAPAATPASSSTSGGASHFATAKAALQAEAAAEAAAAAAATACRISSDVDLEGVHVRGAPIDVCLPPPPPPPLSSSGMKDTNRGSQAAADMVATAVTEVRQGDAASNAILSSMSSSLLSWPSTIATSAAAPLGGKSSEPVADEVVAATATPAAASRDGICGAVAAPAPLSADDLPVVLAEPVSPLAESQNGELAAMVLQLSTKEEELVVMTERFTGVLSQPLQQEAWLQSLPKPQQRQRPSGVGAAAGGLLRLLLQLGPSLACVGLLLRDTAVQRRLQQLRRSCSGGGGGGGGTAIMVGSASTRALPEPSLVASPRSSSSLSSQLMTSSQRQLQQQQQQHNHHQQQRELGLVQQQARGGREALHRRLVKGVVAAAAAAGVRPAGSRRRRLTSSTAVVAAAVGAPVAMAPEVAAGSGEPHTPWSVECKSHWCKIIRPPPRDSIYY